MDYDILSFVSGEDVTIWILYFSSCISSLCSWIDSAACSTEAPTIVWIINTWTLLLKHCQSWVRWICILFHHAYYDYEWINDNKPVMVNHHKGSYHCNLACLAKKFWIWNILHDSIIIPATGAGLIIFLSPIVVFIVCVYVNLFVSLLTM